MQRPLHVQRAISVTILAVAFFYAILRYHVIKGVTWEHFPLLISNKAISLSSVVFIALSYMLGPLARFWPARIVPLLPVRKFLGLTGFGLGALHGLMSLLLFSPANYPKFFLADGALSLIGELSMLFGVLAFFLFALVTLSSLPSIASMLSAVQWQMIQRMGYGGLVLIFLHVAVMGFEGWLAPAGWPGGLIPISMAAAIVIAAALILRVVVLLSPGEWDDRQEKNF